MKDRELDKGFKSLYSKEKVFKEIIKRKWLGGVDLPDVKSYFKVSLTKTTCWEWLVSTVWHSQMSELPMTTGSLEGDWP